MFKTEIRILLIVIGSILILIGILLPVFSKIPFGKLPGDILIERENFKIYIPITSMLIISILLSLILFIISLIKKH
jgi:uncharacterized protein HemY